MRQEVDPGNLFYTFQHFLDAFERTAATHPLEMSYTPRAVLYLAWAGVPQEHIADLYKADIQTDCIIDHISGRHITTERTILQFLRQYANMAICRYRETEDVYLLRTLGMGHCKVRTINVLISRYRDVARALEIPENEKLCYSVVYKSSNFIRAAQFLMANGNRIPSRIRGRAMTYGDREFIEEMFDTTFDSSKERNRYINDFEQWQVHREEYLKRTRK